MGREYEEGLIRTHQQEAPKKKGEATFWERYRIFDQEIESFSRV